MTEKVSVPLMIRLSFCALALFAAVSHAAEKEIDFDRDILPVLSDNCFRCHGPDEKARQAGLRLDVRDAALAAADSGEKAIVPGKPDESELVRRILSDDPDVRMPPLGSNLELQPEEKKSLRRW